MPLSTVCVSTVSNRPRTWSSYSNIRAKDAQDFLNMNSTEEISIFKDPNDLYNSPTLTRRTLGYSYDFPEKSQKKEKKWSFSNMFRRRKKGESESSSEEESQKKGFLGRRKKKPETKRKKPVKTVGTFDHVVIPPVPRNSFIYNGYNRHEENAVLSDPTGGFSNYMGRVLSQVPSNDSCQKISRESLVESNLSRNSLASGSADSFKKTRREQAKARAAARMTSSRNGSSSEEDSHRSNSSLKVRSEEDLKQRESSSNKKSRAARTERYLKRHSRDGENPYNYLRLSKSDAEHPSMNWKMSDDSNKSPSRSPLVPTPVEAKHKLSFSSLHSQNSSMSGLSTIPPSHNSQTKYRVSNSTSNPSYKPPQSMNDYNNSTKKQINFNRENCFTEQRSFSCDANIHKAPSAEFAQDVLHVQFPIMRPKGGHRNLSLIDTSLLNKIRQPPPPPPRDPNRMIGNHFLENGRPNTFYFDNSGQAKSKSFSNSHPNPVLQHTKKFASFNLHPSFRSTSENHLARDTASVHLAARPSSTTPEANRPQRYITRREDGKPSPESFNYLTDKNPRSRKPIFIKPGSANTDGNAETGSQKALDFWKQIDRQNVNVSKPILKKTRSDSPQMFTSHTCVQTKVFLPSVLQNDSMKMNGARSPSPFKPATPTLQEIKSRETPVEVTEEEVKRKSSNLEEALDELEAIYNSLRLGDEDLLERAEQREKEAQSKKLSADIVNSYPSFTSRGGALSDSSFSYEPFDSVDSPRRKRLMRKNHTLDIRHDDMAFRKINKERANTIADPQSALSKVSYLLASPVHKALEDEKDEILNDQTNEPDITFDDVVYRNVKHTQNSLKVVDPQPPFGIPLGPITPGANSDYLHAKPENIYRPSFKSRKIPDIVKDDLAFRNLRKDDNKGPALPPLSAEDFRNNNSESLEYLKKKRAQRSLSANIGNLINNDTLERVRHKRVQDNDVENEFKTLTDIADAMEIARKVLREKDNKISSTRKAFMSDTDTKYVQSSAASLRESRQNFLNGLKTSVDKSTQVSKPPSPMLDHLSAKPPRGLTPESRRSPKESTPIPISPLEDKRSVNCDSSSSSLDDLLNALAEEAKETTARITKELKLLSEENTNEELDKKLSEIDAVSEHAKLCEKLLECVVDSTELMASTKTDEEEVKHIDLVPTEIGSANVVMSRVDSKEEQTVEKVEDSEHDYENLDSDKELNVDEVDVATSLQEKNESEKCKSPFEEHKAELIASFQELKEHMEDIKLPAMESDNSEKDSPSKVDSIYDNLDEQVVTGEEACAGVLDVVALPIKECAFTPNTNPLDHLFTSTCDIVLRKPVDFNSREDSETSSGFHSNCSCGENSHYLKSDTVFDGFDVTNLDPLESLKSPRLVLETSNKVSRDADVTDWSGGLPKSSVEDVRDSNEGDSRPGTSYDARPHNSLMSRGLHSSDNGNDDSKPSDWYRDPATLAFACSYGLACAHQLASIDLFAILSVLFAVLSFIAALFL